MMKLSCIRARSTSRRDHEQLNSSFHHGVAVGVGRHGQVKRRVRIADCAAQRL